MGIHLQWISNIPVPGYELLLLLGIALAASAVGFYRVVYFVSIGYSIAITAMVLVTGIRYIDALTWTAALHAALILLWGIRLTLFLVRRELKTNYQKAIQKVHLETAQTPAYLRIIMWIGVSILYVLMISPLLFSLLSLKSGAAVTSPAFPAAGVLIMADGLILEAASDRQKSNFKIKHPGQFCNVGTFSLVRYPNYLGEILFWIGSWTAGISTYEGLLQWSLTTLGLVLIILVMMGSAKRLERSQNERYGNMPEYRRYIQTVPILYPWIPLYTLQDVHVLLE